MIYVIEDCEVDVVRREVRRDGETVHVEPQVFDLLVYLIAHRDRVVSKDELFKAVWKGRIVSDATLDSRISAARRAIGDTGKKQSLLRTVSRRGFRLLGEVREQATEPAAVAPASNETPSRRDGSPAARAERPSVAVLPLTNLSGDDEQEYFADGVTEDLITGLSRFRWLRVISRSSSFSFKGQRPDPKQVSRDLGVRYIVGGSIRRSGKRLRISVELVDAAEAVQLWSVNHDRDLQDIFDVQDEIVQTILGALEPEMTAAEWAHARQKPAGNLDAWDQYRRGTWHLYRFDADNIEAAKRYCHVAIASDPDFAQPHAALAYACHLTLIFDYTRDRARTLDEGLAAAKRAIELDERDSFAHAILGRLYMTAREHDLAIEQTRDAIERNPNSPQAHYGLGFALVVAGEAESAIAPLLKAVELSPRDPNLASYGTVLATAYLLLDQPTKAAEWARIATRQPSSHFIAYMHLVIALAELDDIESAQRAKEKLLVLKPDFDASYVDRCWPFKRRGDAMRLIAGLRKLDP